MFLGRRQRKSIIGRCWDGVEKELGGDFVSLQFFDIKTRLGRCWAGFEFLVRRWCGDGVEKMLSREDVSSCFLEKNIFQESAKQGIRF